LYAVDGVIKRFWQKNYHVQYLKNGYIKTCKRCLVNGDVALSSTIESDWNYIVTGQ